MYIHVKNLWVLSFFFQHEIDITESESNDLP
jgi:hypothetical protein